MANGGAITWSSGTLGSSGHSNTMLALSVSTMPVGLIYHLGHTTNVNISLYLHRLSLMSSPALIWIDPFRFNFIFLWRVTFHLCIQEQLSFYSAVFLFLVDSNLATVPSKKAQVVSDSGMHWISVRVWPGFCTGWHLWCPLRQSGCQNNLETQSNALTGKVRAPGVQAESPLSYMS